MSDREEHDSGGSDQDQLSQTASEDDAFHGKLPILAYGQYKRSGSAAKRLILQTSDSSDDDENTRQPAQVSFLATGRELAGQDATTTIRPNSRPPLASLASQNTNNSIAEH